MTFIIISIGARAQITDWADNVLIDTDNAVSPITDVWWLHGWDAAEPSSADWVARRELEQTQNILSPNYLHFPWDCLKCLILSSRGQTNGWPWILQSCSSQVDTGTDQLIRHWMPLKQVSAAQPRHADTHKLIRFQLRWSPGPASDEERDASFKRSNCQQALTGNILIQAQGPSKYFIKFHEIHFLIH